MGIDNKLRTALASNAALSPYFKDDEDLENLLQGIPLTGCIPLQILTRMSVLPLRRYMSIEGKKNSGKSNLGWEICRIVKDYGGIIIYIGTELKENVRTQKRILRLSPNEKMSENNVHYYRDTNTINELQTVLYSIADKLRELDPEGKVPVFVLIDSMSTIQEGKPISKMTPKEKKSATVSEGNNMSAMHRAKRLKQFLMDFQVNYANERPMSFLTINHLHDKNSSMPGAPPGSTTPGGEYPKFLNAWELQLKRRSSNKTMTENVSFKINMRNMKQGSGSERNVQIEPVFGDWDVELNSGTVKHAGYYWDECLTNLLMSDYTSKRHLKEIVDLNKEGQLVSSETLGLKKAAPAEIGRAIHEDEEISKAILDMFDVYSGAVFPSPEEEEE